MHTAWVMWLVAWMSVEKKKNKNKILTFVDAGIHVDVLRDMLHVCVDGCGCARCGCDVDADGMQMGCRCCGYG